jgi:hypothetical protein
MPNGLRYTRRVRWRGDGEAAQLEKLKCGKCFGLPQNPHRQLHIIPIFLRDALLGAGIIEQLPK